MPDKKHTQTQDQKSHDLPPIAEGIEEEIDSPPLETMSGDPAYAPDAEYAAMQEDEADKRRARPD